jgi:hypothetical protein
MERLALIVGTFCGAVLKQCAPVLADILAEGIRRALSDTVEDSAPPAGLADRLRARISSGLRDQNDHNQTGPTGTDRP